MTKLRLPGALVDVAWLHHHLEHEDLVILDASWHLPSAARDAQAEWRQRHIPGARYFDFDRKICAADTDLPHMMPSAEVFTRELQDLGLNHGNQVVIYESAGLFSSPRCWWMLRAMGCEDCALLDGGMLAWEQAGYATESHVATPAYPVGDFVARSSAGFFTDAQAVLSALDDDNCCVLDARPAARYSGAQDEPRAGLRRGHMPGAMNLPFADLCNQGVLKPKQELRQVLAPLLGPAERAICSCGSGVTACVIAFAAHYIGYRNIAVYDGSWCEWGMAGELPVVSD